MVDNLRDRIAEVLFDACCRFDVPDSERRDMADAVIRELGNLRQEPHRFQCGSDDCIRYRIISDWTPNE